jgi:hypothetical protein
MTVGNPVDGIKRLIGEQQRRQHGRFSMLMPKDRSMARPKAPETGRSSIALLIGTLAVKSILT